MGFKLGTNKLYTSTYWLSLSLNDHSSTDWTIAVDILKDRIKGRFLDQVEALQNNSSAKIKFSCGFAVLAIDSLLIETLVQFYKGINETNDQYYRKNPRAFSDFFINSIYFKKHFNSHEKAKVFYNHVRCGILHQAQTKGKTTLNTKSKKMIEWVNPSVKSDGFKINRILFHKALEQEFYKYCNNLLDPKNKILRQKFRKKMNFIAST